MGLRETEIWHERTNMLKQLCDTNPPVFDFNSAINSEAGAINEV